MSVRKNIVSLLISQVLTWAVSLVLLVEAPDQLGEDGFGAVSYAAAFVTFFNLVASLGTGTLLTKEIARDHSLLRTYVSNAYLLKLAVVAVVIVVAIALALLLGNRGDILVLIAVGLVGVCFATFNDINLGALAGLEIMAKPAAFMVAQVYVTSALGLLILAMDWGLIAYGSVFALGPVIPFVGNRLLLRRHLEGSKAAADPAILRLLVRGGIPLMTLTFFNLIYGTIDIPILAFVSGEGAVAWYAVAYRWVGIPIFIAAATVSAYFPRFSAHGKEQTEEFPRLVNRAIRLVLVVSVPAAVGLAMTADELVTAFYTSTYEPVIPLIQILALHIPLAGIDTILAVALIANDRLKRYILVSALAALVNPVACVLLIHWAERNFDNGAIGAAVVTLGTELVVMGGALALRSKGVLDRAAATAALRCVAAGLVIVPVLFVADDSPLAVQVAFGIVAYSAAALSLRVITVGELRRVARGALGSVSSKRRRVPESFE